MRSPHWIGKRRIAGSALLAVCGALLYPDSPPPLPEPASESPFAWMQNDRWLELERRFRTARALGCERLRQPIDILLGRARGLLDETDTRSLEPHEVVFDSIEVTTFELGTLVGACPERLPEYVGYVTRMRSVVKRQSERWEEDEGRVRLYRLLFGGRAALEEVMLQSPPDELPSLMPGDDERSATPSTQILGATIHSGDLLVSRGGSPRSALIAVGSDYQGNFSHVALVHVDERTGVPTIVETDRNGLRHTTIEEYLGEVKLRIMILRPREDLDQLVADPMLPHRAATLALERSRRGHTPYDFAIDHRDSSRVYCSEVPAWAYERFGIRLWSHVSRISAPGTRTWLSDLGVENFETLEPSDLEYDPQLRVVVEWRDPETLYLDHVDAVAIEALLEGAARGDRLSPAWYVLPFVRVLKGYSLIRNMAGMPGPVPEGLSVGAAARIFTLDRRHAALRSRVLDDALEFQRREGYRPPEWQLVRIAKQAREEMW